MARGTPTLLGIDEFSLFKRGTTHHDPTNIVVHQTRGRANLSTPFTLPVDHDPGGVTMIQETLGTLQLASHSQIGRS